MIELSFESRQGASGGPAQNHSAKLPQLTVSGQEPAELNSPQWQVLRVKDGPGAASLEAPRPVGCRDHLQQPQRFPSPLAYSFAFVPFPTPVLVTRDQEPFTCSWTSPGQGRWWELELAVRSETQHLKSPGSSGQPHAT